MALFERAALFRIPTRENDLESGQYESMQRASKRLRLVVPIILMVISGLLHFDLRSTAESLIVMLSLRFALAGGAWLMWILHYDLSVAVAIGFIALAGIAVQTAVVFADYLDQAWNHNLTSNRHVDSAPTRHDLDAAVEFGAVERLRPKMMTVAAATLAGADSLESGDGIGRAEKDPGADGRQPHNQRRPYLDRPSRYLFHLA